MGNLLVIVFIANDMNATKIKHCSHPAKKKSRTTAMEVKEICEILFLVRLTNTLRQIIPQF